MQTDSFYFREIFVDGIEGGSVGGVEAGCEGYETCEAGGEFEGGDGGGEEGLDGGRRVGWLLFGEVELGFYEVDGCEGGFLD